jgi:DNA-binding NarL/FixJ family response regulator
LQLAKRILIADDHESVLRRIRALLESEPDWEVCGEAVNGREAIAKAKELEPDLVILDFAMPRLNGLKAAAEINRFLPEVPIVMFTMYGSALRQEAQNMGSAGLSTKRHPRLLSRPPRSC